MRGFCFVVLSSLSITSPAFAWGQTGHRVTGDIAARYLSSDAARAIEAILGEGESLAEATTWADFMRASPEVFWRTEAGPFHYVTIPKDKSYSDVGAPEAGDAITALDRFARVLKDEDASREDKALALRFTVHIIADLHQPLHAGDGTDRGGNDFAVTFFDELTNLHSVWDSGMIDREQLSYSEMADWLAAKISEDEAEAWREPDPQVWIAESAAIRDTIYPEERDLRWGYVFDHIGIVKTRLSMGGVRTAAYLNAVFDD